MVSRVEKKNWDVTILFSPIGIWPLEKKRVVSVTFYQCQVHQMDSLNKFFSVVHEMIINRNKVRNRNLEFFITEDFNYGLILVYALI